MKKEEIHLGDWHRILFGQTPPEFMIEVAIRTVLIYILLLVAVRLMGKRMTGQMTFTELSVMITLGAIVSPVMQLPDRGVVFGLIVLAVALVFQRGLNQLAVKKKQVETIAQGSMSLLIKDGALVLEEIEKVNLSRQQIFAMLREKKIQNLGIVKRGYLEACGIFSVYLEEETKPGLPLFPPSDQGIKKIHKEVSDHIMACCNCGHVQKLNGEHDHCEICHTENWSKAYLQEINNN